jgi:chaperonin GroES
MKIKPLFDRVVIEEFEANEKTSGGIILPSSVQEKPQMAVVVAVGEGGLIEGKEVRMYVRPGDKILYSKYAGMEYKFNNRTYTIIRQGDILAIVEE